jgi:glutaconate CoA-transferase, subunit B
VSRVDYTPDEMMTVAASRALKDGAVCFVGIGLPSAAANLARATRAPNVVLVYESGTIGAKPGKLPLSIGDKELAEAADTVVSLPEIFNYWLQPGRVDVGMLSGAQLDRYANLNSTVIGTYDDPNVRLPGAGGAPGIAASCREVIIVVRHSTRTFVERLDFVTTVGYLRGPGERQRLGLTGAGPTMVITDLGLLHPRPGTLELELQRGPGRLRFALEADGAGTSMAFTVALDEPGGRLAMVPVGIGRSAAWNERWPAGKCVITTLTLAGTTGRLRQALRPRSLLA